MEWIVNRTENSPENVVRHSDDSLQHHGIFGMKWGIRRYQNKDGSWTAAGRKHRAETGGKREFTAREQRANKKQYENSQKTWIKLVPADAATVQRDKDTFNQIKENVSVLKAATELPEYKKYQQDKYDYDEYMYQAMWTNPESKRRVYEVHEGEIDGEITHILRTDSKAEKLWQNQMKSYRDLKNAVDDLAVEYMGTSDKNKYTIHGSWGPYAMVEFCDYDYGFNVRPWDKDMSAWQKLDY